VIRVLLADDQTLLRQGLAVILSSETDLEVVGQASNGREAVELARRLAPDVILMDIRMPETDGVEAAQQLCDGPARVVLLTTYDDDDLVLRGMQAGAAGYLLKDQPAEEIVEAVRSVARGEALFRTSGAARAIARLGQGSRSPSSLPAARPRDALTERETEVLKSIAGGLNNRQIADRLVISEATVKTHINNIFAKLDLQDRAQAVAYAFTHGLA
jgi:DNA-binding NarL/FixJ family response regulator